MIAVSFQRPASSQGIALAIDRLPVWRCPGGFRYRYLGSDWYVPDSGRRRWPAMDDGSRAAGVPPHPAGPRAIPCRADPG